MNLTLIQAAAAAAFFLGIVLDICRADAGGSMTDTFENLECNQFVSGLTVPGPQLGGSGTITATNQECVDLCFMTATCNAIIRPDGDGDGRCILKSVPLDVTPIPRGPDFTIFAICPSGGPSPSMEFENLKCNEFLSGLTVRGPQLAGSGTAANDQECINTCIANPPCNAIIRPNGNRCILKNVATDVSPIPRGQAFTLFVFCPSGAPPPPPFMDFENLQCNQFLPALTVPGPQLEASGMTATDQECLDLCFNTDTCNAIIRPDGDGDGRCILKSVSTDVSPAQRNENFTLFVICPTEHTTQ